MTRAMDSLGLLPSGPDPVGEWLVHHQPPAPYMSGFPLFCKCSLVFVSADCGRECVTNTAQVSQNQRKPTSSIAFTALLRFTLAELCFEEFDNVD